MTTFASLIAILHEYGACEAADDLRVSGIKSLDDLIRANPYAMSTLDPRWKSQISNIKKVVSTRREENPSPCPLVRRSEEGTSLRCVATSVKTAPSAPSTSVCTVPQGEFASLLRFLRGAGIADSIEFLRLRGTRSITEAVECSDDIGRELPEEWRRPFSLAISAYKDHMEKTSATVVPPRRDFPPVTPATRGSIDRAMAAASSERAPAALAEIEDLKFSNSSKNSRSAQWKTWAKLAEAWCLPPLPLSVDLVNKMAASFRAGGYRSTSNYFARAKEQHLQCIGEPVSPRTSCAIKQAIRAADRGALSTQLKESFELELFASPANQTGETAYDTAAEYIRSTEFAINFTILGSWWMTREIELAAAKIVDVEQTSRQTVRWKLPASKNDTAGKGVWRSHGCCCSDKQGADNPSFCGNKICPFHVMTRHIKLSGPTTESTPLFPNLFGQHLSKHESILLIHKAVAWIMGFDDSEQVQHIGGHALRVAGAQALARAGTDTTLIQLVGRWGSAAILRYIQSAPLERSHLIASDMAITASRQISRWSRMYPDPSRSPRYARPLRRLLHRSL